MVFEEYIKNYEQELLESVIPFWESHCIDKECGGFLIPSIKTGPSSTLISGCGSNGG